MLLDLLLLIIIVMAVFFLIRFLRQHRTRAAQKDTQKSNTNTEATKQQAKQ